MPWVVLSARYIKIWAKSELLLILIELIITWKCEQKDSQDDQSPLGSVPWSYNRKPWARLKINKMMTAVYRHCRVLPSREPAVGSCHTFRSTVTFTSKSHFPQAAPSQWVSTVGQGLLKSGNFCPKWNSSNGQPLLRDFLSLAETFSERCCIWKLFLSHSPFPFSIHRWQSYVMIQSFPCPLLLPLSLSFRGRSPIKLLHV